MKIIDAHLHVKFENRIINISKVDYSLKGLLLEMKKNNVESVLSLPIRLKEGILDKKIQSPWKDEVLNSKIFNAISINPYSHNIKKTEEILKKREVRAIKIYLGYFPVMPYDKIYHPYYKLAEKYNIPVIFHTGDTYSKNAKLKYAHPLNIDEVAVDFPNTKFVIAHMGNPWFMDSAVVIYKNKNVYCDISGLEIGTISDSKRIILKEALEFCGYEKIMYGSDWPIISMEKYISLIKKIIPKKYHSDVFYNTAKKVYNL